MDTKKYIEETNKVLLHTYNRAPVILKEGKGVYLLDTKGKEYLDFGAGIAVAGLGYGNKELEEALCQQVHKLLHTSNLFYHELLKPAAEALTKISQMDQVFFTNSGTEAIEGALKAARKYAYENNTGKKEFIAMNKAFHGRTMGALSVTGTKAYRDPFTPLIPDTDFVDFNDIEALKEKITDKTCAIILEPIQGEGGIYPADKDYLKEVRRLCDEKEILLIFDEIKCGMGRTGAYFAWQKYQVKPDILVMA
ncbi:MAG TPA: aminotransferase class III-fold pyridoxal phosphate-dependent enzyme, partial [Candidatus Dorea intestinavium]|nr:aminotransferase class III-fold pyridoxal phosphate-dependent enzyme [Candidatus Dorea intestinavium]